MTTLDEEPLTTEPAACSNCGGSGMDSTKHFDEHPSEPHQCAYCAGSGLAEPAAGSTDASEAQNAAQERGRRYAEAIHEVTCPGRDLCSNLGDIEYDTARAVMAVADAELAEARQDADAAYADFREMSEHSASLDHRLAEKDREIERLRGELAHVEAYVRQRNAEVEGFDQRGRATQLRAVEAVERSSLGTPGAKTLRESVSDEDASRVVAQSYELEWIRTARHWSERAEKAEAAVAWDRALAGIPGSGFPYVKVRDLLAALEVPAGPPLHEPTDRDLCCAWHNHNCEPPSELCCERCTEAMHPNHPKGVSCTWLRGVEPTDRDGDHIPTEECPACKRDLWHVGHDAKGDE